MFTSQLEGRRGYAKPDRQLTEYQLREIGDSLLKQAEEYYAIADGVRDGCNDSPNYRRAVNVYYGDIEGYWKP